MNPLLKAIIRKERREFEELSSGRTLPGKAFDGVTEERNIPYIHDGDQAHRMDLYRPNTARIPTPVIINIHGGGLIKIGRAHV